MSDGALPQKMHRFSNYNTDVMKSATIVDSNSVRSADGSVVANAYAASRKLEEAHLVRSQTPRRYAGKGIAYR